MPSHDFCCYALYNSKFCTYIGTTNDLQRRLRQHNGEISGGAKSTRGRGPWKIGFVISGFMDRKHALQFEWAAKRCSVSSYPKSLLYRSVLRRLKITIKVMKRQRFTTKACLTTPRKYRALIRQHFLSDSYVNSAIVQFPDHLHVVACVQ